MDDSMKTILKFAAVGVGAYILYNWLQTSGLWAQWFGGGNSFTNPQQLLTYCQANPSGTAIYVGANGVPNSAPCSQWVAANTASGAVAPVTQPVATPAATATAAAPATVAPAANSTLIAQLTKAAAGNMLMPNEMGTVSDWNYLLTQLFPNATQIQNATPAGNNTIGAAQYVAYYLALYPDPTTTATAAGLTGYDEPYQWTN
jgi:hypothetical protein